MPAQAWPHRAAVDAVRVRGELRSLLDAAEAAPPAEGVDALAAELAARVGASEVSLLIADISGRTLARLARRPAPDSTDRRVLGDVLIQGTPAGEALVSQRAQTTWEPGGVRVHVPVTQRGEAVGAATRCTCRSPTRWATARPRRRARRGGPVRHGAAGAPGPGLRSAGPGQRRAHHPLLVRDGRVTELPLEPGLVLGVASDETYEVQRFALRPHDRLVLVTDGMFERDAAEAEIEALLATLGHLHLRQTVQVLTAAVLQVTGGAVRDDATVLVVDWHGPLTVQRSPAEP